MVLEQHLGVGNVLEHTDKDDGHVALLARNTLLRVIVAGNLFVRIVMAVESLQIKYKVLAAYLCNCVCGISESNQSRQKQNRASPLTRTSILYINDRSSNCINKGIGCVSACVRIWLAGLL